MSPAPDEVTSTTRIDASRQHGGAAFTTTHWSVVLEAQGDSPAAQEALEKLCHMYWRPIFDVTGGNFPAAPVQQQDWTNGGDGLWRWMPSLAADQNGNIAIGYSTSSSSIYAGIRYAGRLSSDPLNDLGQGEAIMTNGSGARLTPWVAGATIP